ncbi:hypothetical protein SNE40_010261 [Patella caerulea]
MSQLLMVTWLAIICMVTCKPLRADTNLSAILGDKISPNLQDKAEAIDTLLQLLSEIDLPAICDAISAQKKNPQMQTVDAILAEVAKSQAMTFIPTNLPETVDVTRPGTISDLFLLEIAGS